MSSPGIIGEVTVDVQVEQKGATVNSDFIPSGFRYVFRDHDNSSQSYIVSIIGDDIPERDEDIVIKLVNPTGGARVATGNMRCAFAIRAGKTLKMHWHSVQYNAVQFFPVYGNADRMQCDPF